MEEGLDPVQSEKKERRRVKKEKKKKDRSGSPVLPTRLVFQKEPYDTLWYCRFKGTYSEGDLG